jgi:hypothetical protein
MIYQEEMLYLEQGRRPACAETAGNTKSLKYLDVHNERLRSKAPNHNVQRQLALHELLWQVSSILRSGTVSNSSFTSTQDEERR